MFGQRLQVTFKNWQNRSEYRRNLYTADPVPWCK